MLTLYEDLRNICVIAEEMHITRAAKRLHLSQQTLSNCLRRVEKDCGTPLFERQPRLRLTAAGELFIAHATAVLEQAEQFSSQLAELRTSHGARLRIGVNQTQSQTTLPSVLAEFFKVCPDVKTEVCICPVYDLDKKLIDGDIDLMLRASRKNLSAEFDCEEIAVQTMCLCVPNSLLNDFYTAPQRDELARLAPAELLERLSSDGFLQNAPYVLNGPWLSAFAHRFFRQRGLKTKVLLEFHNTEMIFALGYARMGVTFIHSDMAALLPGGSGEYALIPLKTPNGGLPLLIVTRRGHERTRAAQKFIETAKSVCAAHRT